MPKDVRPFATIPDTHPLLSRRAALVAGFAFAALPSTGRASARAAARPLLPLVKRLAELVQNQYQDPVLADAAARKLIEGAHSGAYSNVEDPERLAELFTRDLVIATSDKHLKVSAEVGASAPTDPAHDAAFLRSINYGIMSVRQTQAEIAVVTLNLFPELASAPQLYSLYAAVLNLVASSRGLVFDLRGNMGGSPQSVAYLMSYFFDDAAPRKVAVLRYRARPPESLQTTPRPIGPRYGARRPVAILVSHSTFSGGEAFAYHMRAQGRAVIVGEASGGGANPGDSFRIDDTFSVFVPTGRVTDAVTGKNWEGAGVIPDIAATGDDALRRARLEVLKVALDQASDANARAEIQFGLTHSLAK